VNAPCFTVFLIDRTIHGVDCSCMNQNMEVGRGREVVYCMAPWQIPIIYLFSFVYYIWSDLFIISVCSSHVKELLFH
jgi:hypothetical protein